LTPDTTTRPSEASIVLQESEIHGVPRQTLTFKLEQFTDVAAELGIDLSELKPEDVYEPWRKKPLLDDNERWFLTNTIAYRDHANTGMTRAEILSLMMELKQLAGPTNRKKCHDHFDFLIRTKKLPELKRGGRVVAAQATRTSSWATSFTILRVKVPSRRLPSAELM
jgi:hypothetical protein